MDILPVLVQVVSSGVNLNVCYGVLSVINKILYFNRSDMLPDLLEETNISSFLASMFARKDNHVLVLALCDPQDFLPETDFSIWYEPLLVQEMLTLIIQIVKERRFCGLSTAESVRRELVYKLAIGDATHSQLEKMRAAQSKFIESLESSSNEVETSTLEQDLASAKHVEEVSVPVCSFCHDPDSKHPISLLVFLQKSRLASFVERGPLLWEQAQSSDTQRLLITRNESSDPYSRTMSSSSDLSSHLEQLVQSAVNEFTHDVLPGEVDSILDFIKARLPAARTIQHPSTSSDTRVTTPSSIMVLSLLP